MEKILLINTPLREKFPEPRSYPLGLAYIATSLKNAGAEIKILDIDGFRLEQSVVRERLRKHLKDIRVVGITGLITAYRYIKWLVNEIRTIRPDAKIIVGGPVAGSLKDLLLLNNPIDYLVLLEGEETIVDLLQNVDKPQKVKGIAYLKGKKIIETPPRPPIDMDSIPWPDWDFFPTKRYIKNIAKKFPRFKRVMAVSTVRGCPFRCTFCYHSFYGMGTRFRSPRKIVDEIKELKKRYGVDLILFNDDLFIANKKRAMEFCNLMIKEKVNVNWVACGRVNLVDYELLKKIKSAGCVILKFGIESASPKILKEMKKDITPEMAKKSIRAAWRAGLVVTTSFMVGLPGETPETIQESVDFCKDMGIAAKFYFTCPYPGTELWDQIKHKVPDKEKFVMELGDVSDFHINMTDMPDEQLIRLRNNAIKVLERHCAHPKYLPRRISQFIKINGPRYTFFEGLRTIRNIV